MKPHYIDVHSHLFFKDYDQDLEEVLSRMRDEGVWTITVGVDLETSKKAVEFNEGKDGFFATIGLHPTDTKNESFRPKDYEELARDPKTVGVGECGLDYYRLQRGNERDSSPAIPKQGKGGSSAHYRITENCVAEKKRQRESFERQIDFALTHDKPLMLHCRPTRGSYDAYEDVLSLLESRAKKEGERLRGNVHFFVGNVDIARRFYDIGFTTSFTGVVTFAREYDEVIRFASLSNILTETDSPFASPNPFRGKRNEPSYVKYVVQAIATIRKADTEDVREAVVGNALRVFGMKEGNG